MSGFISIQPVKAVHLDIDELDTRYLQKTGGSISSNLIINGSLDVKTNLTLPEIGDVEDAIQGKQPTITTSTDLISNSLTLPTIGDVEDAIQGKQDTIQDGDLTIAKTSGLQTALDNKYDDTGGTIGGDVTISGDLVIGTTM